MLSFSAAKFLNNKKSDSGQMLILLIMLLLIVGSIYMAGTFEKIQTHESGLPIGDAAVLNGNNPGEKNLQITTLSFSTPSPTVTPSTATPPDTGAVCNHDNGLPAQILNGQPVANPTCGCNGFLVVCKNLACDKLLSSNYLPGGDPTCQNAVEPVGGAMIPRSKQNVDDWCKNGPYTGGKDGTFCIGKPVIYLYPLVTTNVDVSVITNGKIVVSDPLYPEGGWKNVLAKPSGELTYQNKTYNELFYETNVENFLKPTNGIIIPASNLNAKLSDIIYKLGLNKKESDEFLDFWLPKLSALNSNYILFSVIEKNAKEAIDNVTINPAPETRIEFLAYFKPFDFPIAVKPLNLPKRPERIGFTEVEWGGTIDNSQGSKLF